MSRRQVPHGPEDMVCPWHDRPMNEVCHKCPKWTQIRGMDPQDHTKQIDKWECSDALTPILLIELGRQIHANAKAIETLTKEVGESSDGRTALIQSLMTTLNRSYDAIAALPSTTGQKLIS